MYMDLSKYICVYIYICNLGLLGFLTLLPLQFNRGLFLKH